MANVYFTMVAVLSCTEMSPVSYYTTIPPLVRPSGARVRSSVSYSLIHATPPAP